MGGLDGSVSGVLTILLAAVRCSTYSTCCIVNVLFAIDDTHLPLTGPVHVRARFLHPNQCQPAGTCHWLNFAVHAGLSAAFGLARGAVARDHFTDKLNFCACMQCMQFIFRACPKRCHVICPFLICARANARAESDASRFIRMWK
jgi:hypothetical protein